MNVSLSDLPAQQLQALFQLHSDTNVNKTLVNLQLAATHIAFMVQQQIEEHVSHSTVTSLCYIKVVDWFLDYS